MTASTRGGLDQKRDNRDARHDDKRRPHVSTGSTTPGRDGDLRLLSQQLGSDLVAQAAHDFAIRPDEHNSHLAAEIGKVSMLGYKSPSHPDSFGSGGGECSFQPCIVDVAALGLTTVSGQQRGRRPDIPPRRPHGRTWRCRSGSVKSAIVRSDVPRSRLNSRRRMDEAHGGFAPIDNGYTLKFMLHKRSARS